MREYTITITQDELDLIEDGLRIKCEDICEAIEHDRCVLDASTKRNNERNIKRLNETIEYEKEEYEKCSALNNKLYTLEKEKDKEEAK